MSKRKSSLEKAIEHIDAEIAVLKAAKAKLEAQLPKRKPADVTDLRSQKQGA